MNDNEQPETVVIDAGDHRVYIGHRFAGVEFPINGIDDYCHALQRLADHNHQEQP